MRVHDLRAGVDERRQARGFAKVTPQLRPGPPPPGLEAAAWARRGVEAPHALHHHAGEELGETPRLVVAVTVQRDLLAQLLQITGEQRHQASTALGIVHQMPDQGDPHAAHSLAEARECTPDVDSPPLRAQFASSAPHAESALETTPIGAGCRTRRPTCGWTSSAGPAGPTS